MSALFSGRSDILRVSTMKGFFNMKKKLVLLVLMASVPAVLAACGGKDQQKNTETVTEETSANVKLGDYKNFSYKPTEVAETTDEDVENEINFELQQNTETKQVTDRKVQEGDTVSVTYTEKVEDSDPETVENSEIIIGEGYLDEEFEKQIIGADPGKEITFSYTIPDTSYDTENIGKKAEVTATVNYISEAGDTPDFDDSWVKENTDCQTTDEYKAEVEKRIQNMNQYEAEYADMNGLLEQLIDSSSVEIPDTDMDKQIEEELASYEAEAADASMTLEEYAKEYYQYDSIDELKDAIRSYLESDMKRGYIEDAFLDAENLSVTEDGKQDFLESQAALYGYASADDMKEELENFGISDAFDDTYKEEIVGRKLLEYAKAE